MTIFSIELDILKVKEVVLHKFFLITMQKFKFDSYHSLHIE